MKITDAGLFSICSEPWYNKMQMVSRTYLAVQAGSSGIKLKDDSGKYAVKAMQD